MIISRSRPAPAEKPDRGAMLRGMAISKSMISAAQSSYEGSPEYGLTDSDMARAIKAAIVAASRASQ